MYKIKLGIHLLLSLLFLYIRKLNNSNKWIINLINTIHKYNTIVYLSKHPSLTFYISIIRFSAIRNYGLILKTKVMIIDSSSCATKTIGGIGVTGQRDRAVRCRIRLNKSWRDSTMPQNNKLKLVKAPAFTLHKPGPWTSRYGNVGMWTGVAHSIQLYSVNSFVY